MDDSPYEPAYLDRYIKPSDKGELESRLYEFNNKKGYEKYSVGLVDAFFMLTCSSAIKDNRDIISIQYFPNSPKVIEFYNDMYLLRFNRLAELLEPILTHQGNPLNVILLRKSANLFRSMYEIEEEDDLMKKQFFLQTHMQIREVRGWRLLPEFIQNCK